MKKTLVTLSLALASVAGMAQVPTTSSYIQPHRRADICIPFRILDTGKQTPLEWGLDVAWISDDNIRIGTAYAGKELIDIVRTSYRVTESVADGALSNSQKSYAKRRADIIKKYLGTNILININSDPENPNAWYNDASVSSTVRGQRWAKCIDLHYDYYKAYGFNNIVSISPFNEPDYGWSQGVSTMQDMKSTCRSLKEDFDGKFDGVRISGGNTLNNDRAYEWWNYLKPYVDEGNTHQLAGSFNTYASFFTSVRNAGQHATADELHNTMDAMVGAEYGMQTGIWWGTCEHTRSQFMKATSHKNPGWRLGYAENRNHWVAGSVYRLADGRVQGFAGTSERQAWETNFCFTALDRPTWFNGLPGRNYWVHTPGGKDYQKLQKNCETMVDIQSGEDIMPYLDPNKVYKIMNVNSGYVMGFSSKPTSGFASLTMRPNNNTYKFLQWKIYPTPEDLDMAYYFLELNTDNNMMLDVLNWNANPGADIGVYPGGKGGNEQYYIEYAGKGAFYIRSRFSTLCLEVKDGSKMVGANVQMGRLTGAANQQWRFIEVGANTDLVAPAAPSALLLQPQSASIMLSWVAPADKDLKSYTILRSEDGTDFYTIANNIAGTQFLDNEVATGKTYYYKVYAEDRALNRSICSEVVSTQTEETGIVAQLPLSKDFQDLSPNLLHAAALDTTFTTFKERDCYSFDGVQAFMQLPGAVASHDEMSVSFWFYYRGGTQQQHLFDFYTDATHYMYLSPQAGHGLQFAIRNGGEEQVFVPGKTLSTIKWQHIVLTLGKEGATFYLNGELLETEPSITIKPSDICPVFNYIGQGQSASTPMLKGYLSDFTIYNRVLTPQEINDMATGIEDITPASSISHSAEYDISGMPATPRSRFVVSKGKLKVRR